MTDTADKTALDMVYAAATEAELATAYAAWANGYDIETASARILPALRDRGLGGAARAER